MGKPYIFLGITLIRNIYILREIVLLSKQLDKKMPSGGGGMIKTFKMRLFMAVLIVAMASIAVRTPENQESAKAVLQYVLKDYGIQQRIVNMAFGWFDYPDRAVPTVSPQNMQIPCDFLSIDKHYGWTWNAKTGQEELFPGIRFKVPDNSLIQPIMDGKVIELNDAPEGRSILLEHNNNIYSIYSGLKEVLVAKGSVISVGEILGKSGTNFYLEIRGPNGPIDPQLILE